MNKRSRQFSRSKSNALPENVEKIFQNWQTLLTLKTHSVATKPTRNVGNFQLRNRIICHAENKCGKTRFELHKSCNCIKNKLHKSYRHRCKHLLSIFVLINFPDFCFSKSKSNLVQIYAEITFKGQQVECCPTSYKQLLIRISN